MYIEEKVENWWGYITEKLNSWIETGLKEAFRSMWLPDCQCHWTLPFSRTRLPQNHLLSHISHTHTATTSKCQLVSFLLSYSWIFSSWPSTKGHDYRCKLLSKMMDLTCAFLSIYKQTCQSVLPTILQVAPQAQQQQNDRSWTTAVCLTFDWSLITKKHQ